ncbi:hypothetical protein Misp01_55900 [Microtetraspora sp. NBRC 13810]|uniref:hypothetical protein n=1 Tax=Microtetraspora sp. NBRC 13810 TaxID=3030990 RepID=UPI0024A44FB2|nr:hypothetical protein [Microtetraspora sp. NBRC 13810]GLW10462.1 hypothetical protein Misp01_55900 [Microtetraspora sp. NBRC 13810]
MPSATPGRDPELHVDQHSLRTASADIHRVADRLDELVRRTLGGVPGQPVEDPEHPGAEFDMEYASLMGFTPQAYASLVARLRGVAGGVSEHSGSHERAERANEAVSREV